MKKGQRVKLETISVNMSTEVRSYHKKEGEIAARNENPKGIMYKVDFWESQTGEDRSRLKQHWIKEKYLQKTEETLASIVKAANE